MIVAKASKPASSSTEGLQVFCKLCVIPSLVEVQEEQDFISEAGKVMRRGDGYGEKGGNEAQICDQCVHSLEGN